MEWPLGGGTESQRAVGAGTARKGGTDVGVSAQLHLTKPLLHNEDVSSPCIQKHTVCEIYLRAIRD